MNRKISKLIILGITLMTQFSLADTDTQYYDVLLLPEDEWNPGFKEFVLLEDGSLENPDQQPSKFLHGTNWKSDANKNTAPLTFFLECPTASEFIFSVERVSVHSDLVLWLNQEAVDTLVFPAGAGKGPWRHSQYLEAYDIYQATYDSEYRIKLPAGKQELKLENLGPDWISFNYFIFTQYSPNPASTEYESWKTYQTTLPELQTRIEGYEENFRAWKKQLTAGDRNFELMATIQLYLKMLEDLKQQNREFNFDLMRTENEMIQMLDTLKDDIDYFRTKRGRVKRVYTSEMDGSLQPYDVMTPDHYDPEIQYALLVNLHGYEVDIQMYRNFLWADSDPALDDLQLIKAAAYGRRNHYYTGAGESDVLQVIHEIQKHYSVDENRIYLAGASMGGYGTWKIALNYPDLFAAISPLCGPSNLQNVNSFHFPSGGKDQLLAAFSPVNYVENASYLPADIQHGAVDETVSVEHSRQMVKRYKALNLEHRYTEYPQVGHSVWNNADADTSPLPYLLQFSRNPYPKKVTHKTFFLRHGKSYWMTILGKTDWNQFAAVEAEILSGSEILVKTDNVSKMRIDFDHPDLSSDSRIQVSLDNSVLPITSGGRAIEFILKEDGNWMPSVRSLEGLVKKPGLEGPWIDAEKMPGYKVIKGTGTRNKLSGRAEQILLAINQFRDQYDMLTPTLDDKNVKPNTSFNMHLIGIQNGNSVFEAIKDKLPLQMTDSTFVLGREYSLRDHGLRMIYPNPGNNEKYILVDLYPENLAVTAQVQELLVPDYLIYRVTDGSVEVVDQGFFNHFWEFEE